MADVPASRVTYDVKRLESAVRRRLDVICRDVGVSTAQYTALSVLRSRPGMSSAQLAERSFIRPQSANQTVAELERLGFIERAADELNHRILRTNLTDQGRLILEACDRAVDRLEEVMFEGVSVAEASALRQVMNRCIRNLSG
ncbi:MAG: MarR family transcriptional regulator [Acidobacteriota bacterium]|nr:MarR family transcriptional regulator [Acidobacteriota bacterium]